MEEFLQWLLSTSGMSVVAVYITQLVKKVLKLEGTWALVLTGVVTAVILGLAYAVVKFEWYTYVEEYWPLVLVWWAVTFGGANAIYKTVPKTESKK